ncbi:hypothetical protein AB1Y20_005735 [Prymnesium parvum]|uniref:PUB domain-containing protein n=1 Tax=Prymnesium parvum TaxID=97485 RepID=A0AB34J0M8_PRYPA|mmetsp:Transcript_11810/g.29238  ORF Transcript_11810/g.29238 Transcript_11810/m.29238 type:complete len:171 (+) Transcript_11810:119-631(+)
MSPSLEEATAILLKNEEPAGFRMTTETLFKIVQNVLQHPGDEAFRRLKRSSKTFETKIAPAKGGVRFLRAVGFCEEGEGEEASLVLRAPEEARLLEAKAALKECVKQYALLQEERRRIENERAAEKLRLLREVSRNNSKQQNEEERERQQALLKRDREDFARQRDMNDLR